MKKEAIRLLIGLCVVMLPLILVNVYGCAQVNSNSSDSTSTNYSITGTIGTVSSSGISAASGLSVTHIVAIGSNSQKYSATPSSTGSFTLEVVSGFPYAIGFYNKTGSTITLLGYLRQSEVDWDSLPLIDPASDETSLGTIEVDIASLEATPSILLDELLSDVSMDTATANLYGSVDDTMVAFTNVDVDGNGEFDFDEDKYYRFAILVPMSAWGGSSGEVTRMLNDYNDDFYPLPESYQFVLYGNEGNNNPDAGTAVTHTYPQTVYTAGGSGTTSSTGALTTGASNYGWIAGGASSANFVTPEVIPSGTYTIEVSGWDTYTIKNVKGARIVSIGSTEGIVFPSLKLITNEAGLLTTVHYKWMIRLAETIREATAAEVNAVVAGSTIGGSFVDTAPGIIVYTEYPIVSDEHYHAPKQIGLTNSSIDVSDWDVNFSDIIIFGANYHINSNINCVFQFRK
ncbi:MAG: hypothetical protein ABIE84_02515 [bacterium]